MNEIRDALLRMLRAGLSTKKMQEAYLTVGMNDNTLFEIYSDIADAIYKLIGERTDPFQDSVTYLVFNAPVLSIERRTEMLMTEYRKNHSEQPKPDTMSREKMNDLYRKNGGYMTPEGDW